LKPRYIYEHRDIGLCPKCGAPADYVYVIEGPIDEERENVRVKVKVSCTVCGYTDNKKIIFPVKGLNLIKYLLVPDIRPVIEKLYIYYKVRLAVDESGEGGE